MASTLRVLKATFALAVIITVLSGCGEKGATTGPEEPEEGEEDRIPPNVRIVSPINGVTVSGDVVVKAVATDNVGVKKTIIYIDGVLRSERSSYTWRTSRWYKDVTHSIFAEAMDKSGNWGTSNTISVITKNSVDIGVNLINNAGFEGGFSN